MSRQRKLRRGRSRGLSLALLDSETAQALMRQRIDCGEWWVFVTAGRRSVHFLADLEARHYSGPQNKDFELVIIPALPEGLGVVGVAFARKRRLTTRQLVDFFDAHQMLRTAEQLALGEKDVFCLGDNEREGFAAGLFVERLLYGNIARK